MAYTSGFIGLPPKELQALSDKLIGGLTYSSGTVTTAYTPLSWTLATSPYSPYSGSGSIFIKDVIPKHKVTCDEHYNEICGSLAIINSLKYS